MKNTKITEIYQIYWFIKNTKYETENRKTYGLILNWESTYLNTEGHGCELNPALGALTLAESTQLLKDIFYTNPRNLSYMLSVFVHISW